VNTLRLNRSIYFLLVIFSPALVELGFAAAQTAPSNLGQMDGPAELPRIYVRSALADTPANGKVWQVKATENFQETLNNSQCGDVLELQAGATFSGEFRLPAKSCDDQHWIIIRTSAADSSLPAEGTRLTPCYAGVTSLPGRPVLRCSSTQPLTAKLVGKPTS
jgi:hypothetical protein